MGNVCQVCRDDKGNFKFDLSQRKFINAPTLPTSQSAATASGNLVVQGDAPNPQYVTTGISLPDLSPLVKGIISRQNSIRPFATQMTSGIKLQPYQLKNKGMCYDGQWRAGVPHGLGRAYYFNGGYFQGYFKEGVVNCSDGIFIYPDGTFFRGSIKDSSANGHGMLVYKNGQMVYNGQWVDDKPHGMGKEQYKDGSSYVGDFAYGVKEGSGTFKWPDGSEYIGQFKEGFMHGNGSLALVNGDKYRGTFFRNSKQGWGTLETPLGIYKGQFTQDKKFGQGEFRFPDGRIFKGAFYENLPQGYGSMTMPNGQTVTGVWKNGTNIRIQGGDIDKQLPAFNSANGFAPQPLIVGSIVQRA